MQENGDAKALPKCRPRKCTFVHGCALDTIILRTNIVNCFELTFELSSKSLIVTARRGSMICDGIVFNEFSCNHSIKHSEIIPKTGLQIVLRSLRTIMPLEPDNIFNLITFLTELGKQECVFLNNIMHYTEACKRTRIIKFV